MLVPINESARPPVPTYDGEKGANSVRPSELYRAHTRLFRLDDIHEVSHSEQVSAAPAIPRLIAEPQTIRL